MLGACLLLTAAEGPPPSAPGQATNASAGASLMVTPPPGAQDQPTSTEISAALPGGRISAVTLTGAAGNPVPGALRSDGTAWVPAQPLTRQTTYHATVTTVDAEGIPSTATTNFTTMSKSGAAPIVTTLELKAGGVYGVGMPIPLTFSAPIPNGTKADVERRLSVKSDPPQTGAWRWFGDQQVIYRPKDHWKPGTKLTVSTKLGGLPVAGGQLDTDRNVAATIGNKTTFQITNASKQMQVFQNDKLVKTLPVSLGKPETPTSSGNMVIMSREPQALWVYGPGDQIDVRHAERLTGDGEYIHGAPWSVADQGRTNVSHGCTNLSPENAEWVHNNSQIGDPVTVTGTEKRLDPGNGWTVWDMSWTDFIKK
jgi:lipoprotein-anchoring transpeptidase ErfK/SrfK